MPGEYHAARRILLSSRERTIAVCTLAGIAFFLLCLFVQAQSGAWKASFSAYPDEPAHFVGGVMVRDYIASGFRSSPLAFAEQYYSRYPFFAIGYWPPLFYSVLGSWFFVFGVGRMQALVLVAGITAATAWLIFYLVRQRAGLIAGFCAGFLFLGLPEVQRWTCAVMLDGMVAFFCLAAAIFLIRYVETGAVQAGLGFAVCAASATLTKYSGAYVCVLSLAAIICLGRIRLLRKPGFLIQFFVYAAMLGPWLYFTRRFIGKGLLGFESSVQSRILLSPLAPFELLPPVLLLITVAGLLGLMMSPRAWRPDIAVLALLYLGMASSFVVAPVEIEPRYVLAGTATLLVLSFAGWTAVASRLPSRRLERFAVPVASLVLAAVFLPHNLLAYSRPPKYGIQSIVGSIANCGRATHKRLLVPPDLEGPTIAEFAAANDRANYELRRPFKVFAECDWFTRNYRSLFQSSDEMMQHLIADRVDVIIWHGIPANRNYRHEQLLEEMLQNNPARWRRRASFGPSSDDPLRWDVYEFVPGGEISLNRP